MNDILERIKIARGTVMEDNKVNSARGGVPIDGDLYATGEYLSALNANNPVFYRRYLDQMNYFLAMYKLEGEKDIERLSPYIFRQLIEFGKVAIVKHKNRIMPMAVVKLEYNEFMEYKSVEVIPLRVGYGFRQDIKTIKVKPENCVIIKENMQGLPFIFFWKDIINKIELLSSAATTGSVASIKKFKRNLANNNSEVANLETQSMMDPTTPYINNIVQPASYLTEGERAIQGDGRSGKSIKSVMPNAIDFNNLESSAKSQWDNLTAYIGFEYFQRGRRINTNKKTARNVSGEIDTENVNFDVLEGRVLNWLDIAVKEINDKFKVNVKLIVRSEDIQDIEEAENAQVQKRD